MNAPLVVSVSRLVPRKGMDVLIEAFAVLVFIQDRDDLRGRDWRRHRSAIKNALALSWRIDSMRP